MSPEPRHRCPDAHASIAAAPRIHRVHRRVDHVLAPPGGKHGDWAALAIGLVAPDLALAFGGGRDLARGQLHPRAVGLYNAVHRFWGPLALIAAVITGLLGFGWLVLGLAWATHVALDRSCGYARRDTRGFQRGR